MKWNGSADGKTKTFWNIIGRETIQENRLVYAQGILGECNYWEQ